jgi:S1-C subfamily serine protease
VAWDPISLRELQEAADRFDRPAVEAICARLVADLRADVTAITDDDAQAVLGLLRRKRYFRSLQRVADALILGGHDTARNRLAYAQALIDRDVLTAALSVLDELRARTDDPTESSEASGLLGRAYKQLYVLTAAGIQPQRARYLALAVAAYHDVYATAPDQHLWHGVNAIALLERAAADGVELRRFPRPHQSAMSLAEHVLAAVEAAPEPDVWQQATAIEACLALGRYDDARSWLERYVGAADADAFELASTLRQLEEVWRLDSRSGPGADLLPLLQAELLRREGGRVTVPASDLAGGRLFEALSHSGFTSLDWLEQGLQRCRTVARIEDRFGEGLGTGFLVDGRAFRGDWPAVVLLTNAHVVPGTLYAEDAVADFRGTGAPADQKHGLAEQLWTSPVDELDATILSLDGAPESVTPSVAAPDLGALGSTPPPRAFVIGHPEGTEQPMFSMENNGVLDYDDKLIHYTAATRHGSSGSPVYDNSWQVIALHHAGGDAIHRLHGQSGTYRANEGISIQRIRRAVANGS